LGYIAQVGVVIVVRVAINVVYLQSFGFITEPTLRDKSVYHFPSDLALEIDECGVVPFIGVVHIKEHTQLLLGFRVTEYPSVLAYLVQKT
jgi:hypothetical protein